MTGKRDAPHIRRDRRFFIKQPKRSYYLRFAHELEEMEFQRARPKPDGAWIVAVWNERRGVRIRRPIHVPGMMVDHILLPKGEEAAAAIFRADAHWVAMLPDGTWELNALPDAGDCKELVDTQDRLRTAGS